jgi:ATP adenylyltransferase
MPRQKFVSQVTNPIALSPESAYYIGLMEYLWAPWRMEYIQRATESGCILCQKPREDNDEANLILYRGQHNFIILNAFPYNPGHLMVAPYRHIANLQDLSNEEALELFDIIKKGLGLLKEVMKPTGLNIGLNVGTVAGAGIADHVHTHIVPRWQGDTNFMPVLSDTKVMSEALSATYQKLRAKL